MAGSVSAAAATPDAAAAQRSALSRQLREAIMRGRYVPNQRLVEVDLCTEYGAARGAVRSALQELASDGLVDILRNKGARVRSVSLDEAIEITEVRMVLEGLSAAKAAERVTDEQADALRDLGTRMRAAVTSGEFETYSELNGTLHGLVRAIARHTTSESIITRLGAQVVRYQFQLSRRKGRPSVSLPQHELIISAIVARDPQAARTAMEQHLRSVAEALAEGGELR